MADNKIVSTNTEHTAIAVNKIEPGEITLGISACLLGEQVRYDSSHKRSHFCIEELGQFVSYKAYCPEVAIGLPIPRKAIRQIKENDVIKVSHADGSGDVTKALQDYGKKVAKTIANLSGYVFCAKSPSCGMERVKTYNANGHTISNDSQGLFAQEIMRADPLLPCEENGRLNDAFLRENFILRIFAYTHWKKLVRSGLSKHKLLDFHSQYKYLLMSHDCIAYQELGRMLGQANTNIAQLQAQYISLFMTSLKKIATRKSHTTTLQHLQGYFKKYLNKKQKQELNNSIHAFRTGLVPLLVPITLLKHYLNEYPNAYLSKQRYFEPYPQELKLRYSY